MNIIEVFRSGKRFRRKTWKSPSGFCTFNKESDQVQYDLSQGFPLTHDMILADDWELEEDKFLISESILRRAVERWNTEPQAKNETYQDLMVRIVKEEIANG